MKVSRSCFYFFPVIFEKNLKIVLEIYNKFVKLSQSYRNLIKFYRTFTVLVRTFSYLQQVCETFTKLQKLNDTLNAFVRKSLNFYELSDDVHSISGTVSTTAISCPWLTPCPPFCTPSDP